jgi:O-antigen/teichoic acid export membrane protein
MIGKKISDMKPANRVVVNSGFLYGRMAITIIISLYSTRLVLNALGAVDYGIYNLVGGVIAMLSFLQAAMTTSTQRYMSVSLGSGDKNNLNSVFRSSVLLHLIIGFLIITLLEFGGIFLFDGFLNIPADRIQTAKIVFHLMVVSTFFTINAVPYNAVINAHENMLFDSLAGILEVVLKLGIALLLVYSRTDKLILFGILTALLTILIRILKSTYCLSKYSETRTSIRSGSDLKLIKEMLSFAGWNLFGSLCTIARSQGMAIILNLFFGVLINAAYAIGNQVNSQLSTFSLIMLKSINPQILKSEGGGYREKMLKLSMMACKITFFLMTFFAVPFILEMPFILKVWLKSVPENAGIFCQLFIVLSLFQMLTYPLGTAIQAVGRIKMFQTIVGSLLILNIPVAFILLKLGFPAYSVLIGSICLEIIAGTARVWFAKKITGLHVNIYFKNTVLKSLGAFIFIMAISMIPVLTMKDGLLRAFITGICSTATFIIFVKYIGLTPDENAKVSEIIHLFYAKARVLIKPVFS